MCLWNYKNSDIIIEVIVLDQFAPNSKVAILGKVFKSNHKPVYHITTYKN